MDRRFKAVLMGVALLMGLYLTFQLARVIWFLLLPILVFATIVYLVGYGAPSLGDYGRKLHKAAESQARATLDWLDFTSPTWMWPAIRAARTFLDWLGLQVA
jgi:hypothetical protein